MGDWESKLFTKDPFCGVAPFSNTEALYSAPQAATPVLYFPVTPS